MFALRNKSRWLIQQTGKAKMHKNAVNVSDIKCEEVRIPVPWGHIAGKWWGNTDRRPILMLHGVQDNCNSFDRLIPLLPDNLSYLAIDYPGHGYSSHLPEGMMFHPSDGSYYVRRIQDYFSWDKISLIGHSMGAIMFFLYNSLYPKEVDLFVSLDIMVPIIKFPNQEILYKGIANNFNKIIEYGKLNKVRTFTYEECIDRLHEGSEGSVDKEQCKYILDRGLKKVNGKYCFSYDWRLRYVNIIFTDEDILQSAKIMQCPYLAVESNFKKKNYRRILVEETLNILQKKRFEHYTFEGTHHIHLNNPELCAEKMIPFLKQYAVVDKTSGIKEEIRV